jgi:hypothetical protein|eukprot:COSAG01_NODE_2356_length_7839_cov_206.896641_2_plen_354_part_00
MERPTAWKGRLAHLGQRKWEARPESPAWDKMEQPAAARIYVHPEPEPEPEQHVGSVRGGGPQPAALLGGEVEVSVRTGSNSARAETELDQAREELAIIEEEGREIVEHVHRLEGDVRSAQAALEAERQISEGLRAQLGEREQHSARAYNAHAATIAQNTHMQRELKKLEGEVGVARSAADVEARQKEELERELDREREAANSLLQQMEALEHESSELEALILQRSREKEAEQNASRKLLADLARLQPSAVRGGAGSDGGADGGILRQVAQLEADNAQLMRCADSGAHNFGGRRGRVGFGKGADPLWLGVRGVSVLLSFVQGTVAAAGPGSQAGRHSRRSRGNDIGAAAAGCGE